MKKQTILLLLVLGIFVLPSCSKQPADADTEAGRTSEASTYITDGQGADAAAEVTETSPTPTLTSTPTPTPVPSSTATPTPTPTPTPKPKKGVKISNAVDQTFNLNGVSYVYKIPKVSIGSKNMDKVNKKIKKDLSAYSYNDQSKLADIDYTVYKDKKIISICVTVQPGIVEGKNNTRYYIYNISVKTGKLMKPKDLVRARGKSSAMFLNKVRAIYRQFDKSISVGWKVERGLNRTNLQRVSYEYVTPYVSPKGHLCFAGYVMNLGIPENAYFRFDTVNGKYYRDVLE